jgi:PAS domain S-box-containing protein
MIWGCTALWSFPPDLLAYQVFIAYVLAGLVAGSVGIYSVMLNAFFYFSVPLLLPLAIRFFSIGTGTFYAMGTMILLYWGIMLVTALKLHRDIVGFIETKYENLDLISDLEVEMKVREAAERDLKKKNLEIEGIVAQRTEELLESNRKLVREIEERMHIAAALKENEEKYRELVEDMNDVIFSTDEKGILTYISPVARTMLGYEPEELLDKSIGDIVHPDEAKMLSDQLPKRREGDTRPIEYRLRARTNDYVWVRSSSRAVHREGAFVGIRGILTDISEKRKLEEQIRRSHKMEAVTTLSGGIAHEFNNLLASILGNTELAMMDIGPGHSGQEFLEKSVAAIDRAKTVVKELLSFSRRSQVERKPINLAEIVLDELERLEMSLPDSIVLEKDTEEDVDAIFGDAAQIGQVVVNLWENAVEAMAEGGGNLVMEVKQASLSPTQIDFDPDMIPGEYIRLTVRDSGTGIRAENIGRLFDPYYTTKDFSLGGGLGLAVVHGIVKRHRGGIRVTSVPGKGACFDVFFPTPETMAEYGDEAPNG